MDPGKAAGAKTLLAFGQEGFAAIALGRQEKLEEGLKKRNIHFNEKWTGLLKEKEEAAALFPLES